MAEKKYTKDECVWLLNDKHAELLKKGLDRLPRRSDFESGEVVAIKAFLGPWPRALEEAGLKEARGENNPARNRERRKLARHRARKAKKQEKTAM